MFQLGVINHRLRMWGNHVLDEHLGTIAFALMWFAVLWILAVYVHEGYEHAACKADLKRSMLIQPVLPGRREWAI